MSESAVDIIADKTTAMSIIPAQLGNISLIRLAKTSFDGTFGSNSDPIPPSIPTGIDSPNNKNPAITDPVIASLTLLAD